MSLERRQFAHESYRFQFGFDFPNVQKRKIPN